MKEKMYLEDFYDPVREVFTFSKLLLEDNQMEIFWNGKKLEHKKCQL